MAWEEDSRNRMIAGYCAGVQTYHRTAGQHGNQFYLSADGFHLPKQKI
jgi:hypothetical protein